MASANSTPAKSLQWSSDFLNELFLGHGIFTRSPKWHQPIRKIIKHDLPEGCRDIFSMLSCLLHDILVERDATDCQMLILAANNELIDGPMSAGFQKGNGKTSWKNANLIIRLVTQESGMSRETFEISITFLQDLIASFSNFFRNWVVLFEQRKGGKIFAELSPTPELLLSPPSVLHWPLPRVEVFVWSISIGENPNKKFKQFKNRKFNSTTKEFSHAKLDLQSLEGLRQCSNGRTQQFQPVDANDEYFPKPFELLEARDSLSATTPSSLLSFTHHCSKPKSNYLPATYIRWTTATGREYWVHQKLSCEVHWVHSPHSPRQPRKVSRQDSRANRGAVAS